MELDILNLIRRCELVATVAASVASVCLYTCSYFIVNSADRTLKYAQQLGQNQDANKTGPGRRREREGKRERERGIDRKRGRKSDRQQGLCGLAVHLYCVRSQV